MSKITYAFTFKDGSRAEQQDEFDHDARSDFFLGLSQGFKKNADIDINHGIKKKFSDVRSFEFTIHD